MDRGDSPRTAVALLCGATFLFACGLAGEPVFLDGGISGTDGGVAGTGGGVAGTGGGVAGTGGGVAGAGGGVAGGGSGGMDGGTSDTGGGVAGCGGSLSAGESTRSVTVDGRKRTYVLHVPGSYTGRAAVPLVLDFHGLGGTGSQEKGMSGYSRQSDQPGFVVAFPDGLNNTWNNGLDAARGGSEDDVGFARAIVSELRTQGCIDSKRVYAVGFSMGGGMTYALACQAADVFAAAAPSAFDLVEGQRCTPSRPISVLSFRGTADSVVPYEGKSTGSAFLGAEKTFQKWKEVDECTGSATTGSNGCAMFSTCKDGTQIGLCTIQGGGHAPGNAGTGWSFLSQHTLP